MQSAIRLVAYIGLLCFFALCLWAWNGISFELMLRDDETRISDMLHPDIAVLDRLFRHNSANQYHVAMMGIVEYNRGHYRNAEVWLLRAVDYYGSPCNYADPAQSGDYCWGYPVAEVHLYLGKALVAQGRTTEARHEWREAEQAMPFPEPHWAGPPIGKDPALEASELLTRYRLGSVDIRRSARGKAGVRVEGVRP